MKKDRWPLRRLIPFHIHGIVNWIAWEFFPPSDDERGGSEIPSKNLIWRFNDWISTFWVDWWLGYRQDERRFMQAMEEMADEDRK